MKAAAEAEEEEQLALSVRAKLKAKRMIVLDSDDEAADEQAQSAKKRRREASPVNSDFAGLVSDEDDDILRKGAFALFPLLPSIPFTTRTHPSLPPSQPSRSTPRLSVPSATSLCRPSPHRTFSASRSTSSLDRKREQPPPRPTLSASDSHRRRRRASASSTSTSGRRFRRGSSRVIRRRSIGRASSGSSPSLLCSPSTLTDLHHVQTDRPRVSSLPQRHRHRQELKRLLPASKGRLRCVR